ncbi:MAG: glycosyltransferase family 4 protein [Cyclobacteriaceae bacterium]|nr:glycosyltransferase family 4 protein [Cyclobacteriaceae bacterium]
MSKKMRVGLVLSSVPGYSETFFTSKINGLAKSGFTFYLFANGTRNPKLNCQLITPYPVFRSAWARFLSVLFLVPVIFVRAPGATARLWRLEKDLGLKTRGIIRSIYINGHILSRKLDWLHFGFATMAIGRENVARAIGAKMAVSLRGYDMDVYPLKNTNCYQLLWNRADKVHSISKYLLQKACTLGLTENVSSKIIVPAISKEILPKKSMEFQNPLQLLTIARLHWIKGLEYGIRAVAILKESGINLRYTIIGEGAELERLIYEINELGLGNEISLVGKLAHNQTLGLMRDCDIYIQPSISEGFCNAVIEAQMSGCICIASNVGGLSENVVNEKTGFLVSPRNPPELATAIDRIINMPLEQRILISKDARDNALRVFDYSNHCNQWSDFYAQYN